MDDNAAVEGGRSRSDAPVVVSLLAGDSRARRRLWPRCERTSARDCGFADCDTAGRGRPRTRPHAEHPARPPQRRRGPRTREAARDRQRRVGEVRQAREGGQGRGGLRSARWKAEDSCTVRRQAAACAGRPAAGRRGVAPRLVDAPGKGAREPADKIALAIVAKETFQLDPDLYEPEADAPSKPGTLDTEAPKFPQSDDEERATARGRARRGRRCEAAWLRRAAEGSECCAGQRHRARPRSPPRARRWDARVDWLLRARRSGPRRDRLRSRRLHAPRRACRFDDRARHAKARTRRGQASHRGRPARSTNWSSAFRPTTSRFRRRPAPR